MALTESREITGGAGHPPGGGNRESHGTCEHQHSSPQGGATALRSTERGGTQKHSRSPSGLGTLLPWRRARRGLCFIKRTRHWGKDK